MSSAPPATRFTVPPPGTFRSTEAAVRRGRGRLDDVSSAMVHLAYGTNSVNRASAPEPGGEPGRSGERRRVPCPGRSGGGHREPERGEGLLGGLPVLLVTAA
ncbi:hypothetical protein GCM10018782_34610 [Streptomyces griseoaurantiacus]|nr:hypothetical protein GCM10018782_34610 [Streptomyces griseoaurantiacus]